MQQCGADTKPIEKFVSELKKSGNFEAAFALSQTPTEAKDFVNFTFEIINSKKDYLQSAIFTFGREDLIPDMFLSIINDMYKEYPESISIFKYYLERHIEVDGDHHSHLALQMTASLCGDNEGLWKEAEIATINSLQQRINLWNGVYEAILQKKNTGVEV